MTGDQAAVGISGWDLPIHETNVLKHRNSRFCVLIPVINEGNRLLRQLGQLSAARFGPDVIIADGGSDDGSADPERLAELGVRALLIKRDAGRLSAQLRMGMAFAMRDGYDGVITVDGNGKDDVGAIPLFVRALDAGAGFVQGSRFVPGGIAINTPLERHLAISLIHAPLTSLAARRRFTDTTNGFRGHSREFLLDQRVQPFRSVFESYELLAYLPIRAGRLGFGCTEVPVTRAYPGSGEVPTKIRGRRAQLELLTMLGRAALGRFNPPD